MSCHTSAQAESAYVYNIFFVVLFSFFFSPPGSCFAEQESLTGRISRTCLYAPPHKNGLALVSLIPLLKARHFSYAAQVVLGCPQMLSGNHEVLG